MRVSSGNKVIDELLKGGYEKEIITTIYGPAGSGKTNLCMLAAVEAAEDGRKVIYVDTEGGFSIERLKQLSSEPLLDKIMFLKPTTFEEQKDAFSKLRRLSHENVGMIIVDSIAMLYRLELGKNEDVYETNRELGKQLAALTELARKQHIPVIVTNQIYSSFENPGEVNMVGGDILKYGSKCLMELKKGKKQRAAIIRKHRSLPEGKRTMFKIKEKGIEGINPQQNPQDQP